MHQVAQLKTKEQQLSAISRADHKSESVMIARALIDTKTTWRDMAKVLRECDIEEPEKIRHLVLVYCTRVLLGGKPNLRAAMVIDYFRGHFYDSKKAGLIHACFEVVGSK